MDKSKRERYPDREGYVSPWERRGKTRTTPDPHSLVRKIDPREDSRKPQQEKKAGTLFASGQNKEDRSRMQFKQEKKRIRFICKIRVN